MFSPMMTKVAGLALALHVAGFPGFGIRNASGQEMAIIAQALDICALDTTYYVAPETLNDLSSSSASPTYDFIGDQGGCFVVRPWEGRFLPNRVNLLTAFNAWRGPYLTFQQGKTQIGTTPYDEGSPLDPWGNPYYLFSPLGLLRGDSGAVTLELYGDFFDRYTLVSLGPDGVKSADDLWYQFGTGVTSFALSSLKGTTVTGGPPQSLSPGLRTPTPSSYQAYAGSSVTLRGMNLGSTRDSAQVLFGTQELAAVTRWSDREVDVTLPPGVTGQADLVIKRGIASTNALSLSIVALPAAASDWQLFR